MPDLVFRRKDGVKPPFVVWWVVQTNTIRVQYIIKVVLDTVVVGMNVINASLFAAQSIAAINILVKRMGSFVLDYVTGASVTEPISDCCSPESPK